MPGINNYSNYGAYGNIGNAWNNGWNGYQQPQPTMQQQQPVPADYREFVHGRAGAEAYQLKPGVTMQVLWDDETDRFYVKGYDNNGRPRVLADNDFQSHIEPEPAQQSQLDLSAYATKDDIKQMITEALEGVHVPNLSGYVTQGQFNKALNELTLGQGGRIVRSNESNA